ncbi:MAG: OmpA family protein [Deltaproteobacteria bacterium]|nr:OmpA family protein [Deltaproteobacteria bacterium]
MLYKKIGYLFLAALFCMGMSGKTNAEEWPQSESPDACQGGSQETEPCGRWYYLTELSNPDAWQSATANREVRGRWYGVQKAAKQVVYKKIVYRGIQFDFDKSNIKAESIPILQKDIDNLKEESQKNKTIRIVGHTDSKGSDEYNQKLSERRATAVRDYFMSQGIDGNRLIAEGKGEADPVAPNTINGKDNPEGRAENRRIELLIPQ